MNYPNLIKPLTLKDTTIPNRLVFPPIFTNYASENGEVTERFSRFYTHIASNNVGLTILGAMNKLTNIDYDTLSLAHFGHIHGEEAKSILDEQIDNFKKWWQLFEDNTSKFDDANYMVDAIMKTCYPKATNEEETKLGLLFALPWYIQGFKMYYEGK